MKPILTAKKFPENNLFPDRYAMSLNYQTNLIFEIRTVISQAGFDCSLLNDCQILSFCSLTDSDKYALIFNETELPKFLEKLI